MNKNITKPNIDIKGLIKIPISFNYYKTKGTKVFNDNGDELSSLEVFYEDLKTKSGVFKKCGKTRKAGGPYKFETQLLLRL